MRSTRLRAAFPGTVGRFPSYGRAFLLFFLIAAGILSVLLYLDFLAEKRHEKKINDRQFHFASQVRFAAEDRLAAIEAVSKCLAKDIAACLPEGAMNGGKVREMLEKALNAAPDVLGFYFVPPPPDSRGSIHAFRPAGPGRDAFLFTAGEAGPVKSGAISPGEALKLSGTVGPPSLGRPFIMAEEVRPREGASGVLFIAAGLASLVSKYIVPMTADGDTFGAAIHEDGAAIRFPELPLAAEAQAGSEASGVGAIADLVGQAYSGMETVDLPSGSGGRDRRMIVAWNSVKIGGRRLSVALASSGEIRTGGLAYMKIQRNLLSVILIVFAVLGAFLLVGKQKRDDGERREATLRAIFENAPSGIAILGGEGKFLSCNPAWEAMTGQSEERLRQKTISDLAVPGCPGAESLAGALRGNPESFRTEVKFLRHDGSTFWGSVLLATMENYPPPHAGSVLALISDISGLKSAEELLLKGAADLESQKEELEKQTSDQGILLGLFTLFAEADTNKQVFDALCGSLPSALSFRSFFLCVSVPGKKDEFVVLDNAGDAAKSGQLDFGTNKKGIIGHVLTTGKPYISGDLPSDPLYIPHTENAKSMVAVPIAYKGRNWGVLGMDSLDSYAFTVRERDFLSLVGFYLALHLEEVETRTELDGKAEQLKFLHGVVKQLATERLNVNLSRKIVDLLGGELGFPMAGVFIPDETAGAAGVGLLEGYPGESGEWEQAVFDALSGVAAESLREGRPAERTGESEFPALAVPISFGTEVFAVLAAGGGPGVSASDGELLEIVAEHGATFWVLNNILAERRREALIDPLTQVWNRRFLLQRLKEETARLRRGGGSGVVVIVDLGDFKSINDRFGHLAGDEVLKRTAAMMCENLRVCDVVGRFGGDEFLLYLPDVSAEHATSVMKRLDRLAANLEIPGMDAKVVLDYGLASFPGDGDDLVAAVGDADSRMYEYKAARKAGRA